MHTRELTDLEALLEGHLECGAVHHEGFPCSVEVVALGWSECGRRASPICQSTVQYIHYVWGFGNCGKCHTAAEDCWRYRLI